jgi:curved DNA-binding protein CbpA
LATYYDILKVAFDAPDTVIRAAYRVLAARHHPDRHEADPRASRRMQRINEAWRVLSCPDLRRRYDAMLTQQRRRRASDATRERDAAGAAPAPSEEPAARVPTQPALLRQRAAALYAAHAQLR